MSDKDPAFQWETEALRSSAKPDFPGQPTPSHGAAETTPPTGAAMAEASLAEASLTEASLADTTGWQTLREAHQSTGIPIETLRKWARRGTIPSVLEETEFGTRRFVDPEAVRIRAVRLGRKVAPIEEPESDEREPGAPVGGLDGETAPTGENVTQPEIVDAHPAGTMIVPIDAWDKMLVQLGNLHEAGQQLAEARERAAKAETEAKFLRERLSEVRKAESAASSPVDDLDTSAVDTKPPAKTPSSQAQPSKPIGVQEYAKRRWQAWRRR